MKKVFEWEELKDFSGKKTTVKGHTPKNALVNNGDIPTAYPLAQSKMLDN